MRNAGTGFVVLLHHSLFIVGTSASDCLQMLVSEMTDIVSSGALNSTTTITTAVYKKT